MSISKVEDTIVISVSKYYIVLTIVLRYDNYNSGGSASGTSGSQKYHLS